MAHVLYRCFRAGLLFDGSFASLRTTKAARLIRQHAILPSTAGDPGEARQLVINVRRLDPGLSSQ